MRFCHRRKKTRHFNGVFYRFFVREMFAYFSDFSDFDLMVSLSSLVSRSWCLLDSPRFFLILPDSPYSQLYLSFPLIFFLIPLCSFLVVTCSRVSSLIHQRHKRQRDHSLFVKR